MILPSGDRTAAHLGGDSTAGHRGGGKHVRTIGRRAAVAASSDGPWTVGLALLLVAGAVVLVHETAGLTFWADEWQWILYRRGSSLATYLAPHNPHLSLVPIAIYKALFATVGLRHYWPYRALLIGDQLLCVTLVFIYARRRVGGYMALLVAAMIMFFGPGWQDILWTFQIGWLTPVAAGVGALLLLDRRDRLGHMGACVLLIVGLASAGPALAVAAGVLVDVLLRRRPRDLWIPGIPLVLYALWAARYETTSLDLHAIPRVPTFAFHAADGVFSSLAGLANIDVLTGHGAYVTWGTPILVVALVLGGWRLVSLGRLPFRVLSLLVIPLAFWALTGAGRAYVATNGYVFSFSGDESRYLYIGAVFVLLLVVEVLRGWRPTLRVGAGLGVLVAGSIVSNLGTLRDGSAYLHAASDQAEGALGGLEISRHIVAPTFVSNGFIFGILKARPWFAAERDLGSAAVLPGPIPTLDPPARQAADAQLIRIQGLAMHPRPAAASSQPGCLPVPPGTRELTLPAGGMRIVAEADAITLGVRRFGPGPTPLGRLGAHQTASLSVRPDLSRAPWRVSVSSRATVLVCPSAPA